MPEQNKLQQILKDSNYSLSLFDTKLVNELENIITEKDGKFYVVCAIRDKEIVLKPEEIVRQLYAMKLLGDYGYPKQRIKFEHAIHFGREVKSADIVIFDKTLLFSPENDNSTIKLPGFYGLSVVGQQILTHLNPRYLEKYYNWLKANYRIPNYKSIE